MTGALAWGAPELVNTGFKFLKGIRKEGIHSFQCHDEFMNLHGPKNRRLDYGRRHIRLRLTCGSRSGANRLPSRPGHRFGPGNNN
ncbi:hypothetical protein DBR24_22835 [Pseudomonas sp. HMWF006]|nr:hypothetical protein DBR24_22835 [Pseudomonas sp. HMWF006]PTT71502.1 hypothetical protein DBR26_07580 [Pseudomonas sp. HMWF007]PTT90720.1 hypothetical protein DBR29_12900 [Pseudomonas sp. HMWF005]